MLWINWTEEPTTEHLIQQRECSHPCPQCMKHLPGDQSVLDHQININNFNKVGIEPDFLLFKKICSLLLEWQILQRGGGMEDLPSAGSLPKWPQWLEPSRSEARSQDFLLSLLHRCRVPKLRPCLTALTNHKHEAGREEGKQPGHEPEPILDLS